MTNVTGRDRCIVVKALAYAIEAIQALPPERREESDQFDMKRLLASMCETDAELARVMASAQCHLSAERWAGG